MLPLAAASRRTVTVNDPAEPAASVPTVQVMVPVPPTAGVVWWRATVRARAEAAHTAMQPITVLQSVAGACAAGTTAALASVAWRWMDPADRIGDLLSRLAIDHGAAGGFTFQHALLAVLGIAICLVLAPVALYFTLTDK